MLIKFPGLTTPDESYHGVVYTKQFGKAAYITKINAQLMRDLGSVPSPMNSFILNLGLESLVFKSGKTLLQRTEGSRVFGCTSISWKGKLSGTSTG